MSGEIMAILGVGIALAGFIWRLVTRAETRLEGRLDRMETRLNGMDTRLTAVETTLALIVQGLRLEIKAESANP